MVLLDTDVLVDCLRGIPPAKSWLSSTPTEVFGIPGVAAMELVIGCRNQAELDHLQRFLRAFMVLWPDGSEFARAYEILVDFRLSSGISIPDCLIAAMALSRNARLFTFNLKHFQAVSGLDVQQPYLRT